MLDFLLSFKSFQIALSRLPDFAVKTIAAALISVFCSKFCIASTGNAETRTINFPPSGLGRYFVNRPDVSFMSQWPARDLGEVARGKIVIPRSAVLSLETATASGNYLPKLAALKDNDLQLLDVSGAIVTHSNLKYILGLKQLQSLVLIGTAVDDRDIETVVAGLPELKELNIGYTDVTDHCLRSLSRLKKLSRLHLQKCKLSAAGLIHLANLRSLTFIDLSQSAITDDVIEAVGKIPSLSTLNLAKTNVSDKGLRSLIVLTSLKRLDLSRTTVSDSTLQDILSSMTALEELNLSETKVSDQGIKYLAKLTHLQKLWLRGLPKVTDGAIGDLLKHRQLKDLEIQKTNITEQGVSKLAMALALTEVHSKPPCSCQKRPRVN